MDKTELLIISEGINQERHDKYHALASDIAYSMLALIIAEKQEYTHEEYMSEWRDIRDSLAENLRTYEHLDTETKHDQ